MIDYIELSIEELIRLKEKYSEQVKQILKEMDDYKEWSIEYKGLKSDLKKLKEKLKDINAEIDSRKQQEKNPVKLFSDDIYEKMRELSDLSDQSTKIEKDIKDLEVKLGKDINNKELLNEYKKKKEEQKINFEKAKEIEKELKSTDKKEIKNNDTKKVESKSNEEKNTNKIKLSKSVLITMFGTVGSIMLSLAHPVLGLGGMFLTGTYFVKQVKNNIKEYKEQVISLLSKKDNKKKKTSKSSILKSFKNLFKKKDKTGEDTEEIKKEIKIETDKTTETEIEKLKKARQALIDGSYRLKKNEIIQDKIDVRKICEFYGTNNTNPNYGKKNNDKVMIKR